MMIPKIFHRVWIGETLNQEAETFWQKAQLVNPDWKFITYSQDNLDIFKISGDVLDYCDVPSYKADLIRLECLYLFGGFYIDADVEVFKSFNPLTNTDKLTLAWEDKNNTTLGAAVIGSPPKSPDVLAALNYLVLSIKKTSRDNKVSYTQDQPFFLPNVFNKLFINNSRVNKVKRNYFFPYDLGEIDQLKLSGNDIIFPEESFAAHHWHLSWLDDKSKLLEPKNTKK